MSSIIFTDQRDPSGRTIHYNVDQTTREVAATVEAALAADTLVEVPNEDEGRDPIFINPEHVATIAPAKED